MTKKNRKILMTLTKILTGFFRPWRQNDVMLPSLYIRFAHVPNARLRNVDASIATSFALRICRLKLLTNSQSFFGPGDGVTGTGNFSVELQLKTLLDDFAHLLAGFDAHFHEHFTHEVRLRSRF